MRLRTFLGVLVVLGFSSRGALAAKPPSEAPAAPGPVKAEAPVVKAEKPATSKKVEGPVTSKKVEEPATSKKVEEPATAKKAEEPATDETRIVADGDPPAAAKKNDEEPAGTSLSELENEIEPKTSPIVSVGIGAQFMGGANFLDKPDDQTINGQNRDPQYPGFAGSSIGGGGFIDVRFIDYVGFEFGVLQMTDKGSTELTITELSSGSQARFDVNLKQTALHMPLLLKAAVPGVIAQPLFFVGPEFVVPLANCKSDNADRATNPECQAEVVSKTGGSTLGTKYGIITQNSINVMFGLGAEFKLPIPKVDIRIPLTMRGSINPGVSSKRVDRETDTLNAMGTLLERVDYVTNWKFAAYANIGMSVHF